MRISDWSSDVCSSDLETFTVIASEAEVRFALGLLPGASLPSPTHVAARLTGDLPGEVTLSLNPVRRSIPASDAAASIRDGGWSFGPFPTAALGQDRSEEHTSELQSLMRTSYAVFCLKKKNKKNKHHRGSESNKLNTTVQEI